MHLEKRCSLRKIYTQKKKSQNQKTKGDIKHNIQKKKKVKKKVKQIRLVDVIKIY